MRTYPLSSYARLVVIAAAAVVLSACAHAPAQHRSAPSYESRATYYDYRYYPEADFYYDTRARVYIYYEQDHWVRARSLPPRMRPHLGRHVDIRSPHERPYEDQHRNRKQYAPDRHRSERYNTMESGDQRHLSRPDTDPRDRSSHDRYDSRKETKQDDRNGKEQVREHNPAQRHYSESHQREQRPSPSTPPARSEHRTERRESPIASTAIVREKQQRHERSSRKVEPRFPAVDHDERHDIDPSEAEPETRRWPRR